MRSRSRVELAKTTISGFIDNKTDMTLRLCDKNCFKLVRKYISETSGLINAIYIGSCSNIPSRIQESWFRLSFLRDRSRWVDRENSQNAIRTKNVPEGILAYADDIFLIAESAIKLELMLKTIETEAKKVGLKIKPSKCNYINWENVPKKKSP